MITTYEQIFADKKKSMKLEKINNLVIKDNNMLFNFPDVEENGEYIVLCNTENALNDKNYLYVIDINAKDLNHIKKMYFSGEKCTYGTIVELKDGNCHIKFNYAQDKILSGMRKIVSLIKQSKYVDYDNNTMKFLCNLNKKMWNEANISIYRNYLKGDLSLCEAKLRERNRDVKTMKLSDFIDKWERRIEHSKNKSNESVKSGVERDYENMLINL